MNAGVSRDFLERMAVVGQADMRSAEVLLAEVRTQVREVLYGDSK